MPAPNTHFTSPFWWSSRSDKKFPQGAPSSWPRSLSLSHACCVAMPLLLHCACVANDELMRSNMSLFEHELCKIGPPSESMSEGLTLGGRLTSAWLPMQKLCVAARELFDGLRTRRFVALSNAATLCCCVLNFKDEFIRCITL